MSLRSITCTPKCQTGRPDDHRLGDTVTLFEPVRRPPEIQFDWSKFSWIGSPARGEARCTCAPIALTKPSRIVRTAKEPPKCGATGVTGPDSYLPKLLQETVGAKFQHRHRLPRRHRHRSRRRARRNSLPGIYHRSLLRPRALSHLAQDQFCPSYLSERQQARRRACRNTPTIFELMDQYKTPDFGPPASDRLARRRRHGPADVRPAGDAGGALENSSRRVRQDHGRRSSSDRRSEDSASMSSIQSAARSSTGLPKKLSASRRRSSTS